MLRSCLFGSHIRTQTFGKTICVLVIATVSAFIVWIRTVAVLTIVHEVKYAADVNASRESYSPIQAVRSRLLHMYETHFKSHHDSSLKDKSFTAVILLTYMRSGSSFTGEILQQNDDVFYVFEPLRKLDHLAKTGKPVKWMNGTISAVSSLNITDVKRQVLIGWLTCNFAMVYAQSFDDKYFFSFGKKTAVYNDCINTTFGIKLNYSSRNSASNKTIIHTPISAFRRGLGEKCLQDLQNACLSSKFRIIKTIRTPMNLADDILTEVNSSKVIHLIRDPRETVISQVRYSGCPGDNPSVGACASPHCKKVMQDTDVKQKILKEKPGRVLTVLYEQISSYPSVLTKIIYKFVGMEFTEKIGDYVTRIVQGRNVTGCSVCKEHWQIRKSYSISSIEKNVLAKMYLDVIAYMQYVCRHVIHQYGYKVYNISMTSQSQYWKSYY